MKRRTLININRYMKRIKSNWETNHNEKLLERYRGLSLIPFSCSLAEVERNGCHKKELSNLPPHAAITELDPALIRSYNALCIKTGTKVGVDAHVVLVDVDSKNDTKSKWLEILKRRDHWKLRLALSAFCLVGPVRTTAVLLHQIVHRWPKAGHRRQRAQSIAAGGAEQV